VVKVPFNTLQFAVLMTPCNKLDLHYFVIVVYILSELAGHNR